ncbi:MAG: response regulator [Acidobacteria bacterium]|nr:MAG: response regulator [Acidobacteriota bacterium]
MEGNAVMSTILVVENDSVFAAVLEDHLRVAGHRVLIADEGARAVSLAGEEAVDLVVLERSLPAVSGIEVVRALRAEPETHAVPILMLSEHKDRADRVAALRAGADDYLHKPVDLEELALRVNRLLGHRPAAAPVLAGDVASHPLNELLQYVHLAGKSGRLVVRAGDRGDGEARIRRGKLIAARWRGLRGKDAVLAMLGLDRGRFRFESEEENGGGPTPAENVLPLHDLLLHASWIEDELAARRQHLPATGAPLRARAAAPPEIEAPFRDLPIERIFHRVAAQPGLRLYDLIGDQAEAPMSTRLAVAWLIEQGALAIEDPAAAKALSTSEITDSMLFELTVTSLLVAAQNAGFDAKGLPFLLAIEPGAWPTFKQVVQGVPGYLKNEPLRTLVEKLDKRQAGSAVFVTEVGKLSLHAQILAGEGGSAIASIVSVCGGVLVWLDEAETDTIEDLIQRLEASQGAARGILVAATAGALAKAEALAAGTKRWRVSRHAPKSLLGVLRLLHPES